MLIPSDYLRVNELKNYLYCARISYYTLCLELDRTTALAEGGIRAEATTKQQMQRRKTALHAIQQGQREFDVWVVHHEQQYVGRIDEVIRTPSGIYLVDYKDSERDFGYWRWQMLAYTRAAEAQGATVLGSYIYTIPTKTYHPITFKRGDDAQLQALWAALRQMIATEAMPPPASVVGKCLHCQYQRFCGDIF
jgi:CRISPR-associated protein Cas4